MADDTTTQTSNEGLPEPTGSEGAGNADDKGAANEEPEIDLSDFDRAVAEDDSAVISKAELAALRRQVGQVKTLQREIADLKKGGTGDTVSRAEYDALTEALADLLPEDRKAALDAHRASRQTEKVVDERFSDFEKRIFERMGIKDDEPAGDDVDATKDPEVLQQRLDAAWARASEYVAAKAKEAGVELTAEDFANAQRTANSLNPRGATELLVKEIAKRAKSGGAGKGERIADRKGDAEGGDTKGIVKDGSQGNHDLTTLVGIARARKAGAIDSAKFAELYRKINRESGR